MSEPSRKQKRCWDPARCSWWCTRHNRGMRSRKRKPAQGWFTSEHNALGEYHPLFYGRRYWRSRTCIVALSHEGGDQQRIEYHAIIDVSSHVEESIPHTTYSYPSTLYSRKPNKTAPTLTIPILQHLPGGNKGFPNW